MILTFSAASTRHLYLNFETRKENPEEVWILLTRHVVDSSRTSEFISLEVEVEDELKSYSKAVDQTMIAAKVSEFMLEVIVALIRACFSARTRTVHMFLCVVLYLSLYICSDQFTGQSANILVANIWCSVDLHFLRWRFY
jgi:hypothetical protein